MDQTSSRRKSFACTTPALFVFALGSLPDGVAAPEGGSDLCGVMVSCACGMVL